jgi:hypothetical protein
MKALLNEERYIKGSIRGTKSLFRKSLSPFPLLRGRGIKGDGVI